jgi:hypothetical protein
MMISSRSSAAVCGSFAHAEVVDDEERHGGQLGEVCLPRAVEGGVREFFQQRVRLAIEDAVALLDDGAADGLGEMTFPRPWWPEKERVLPLRDEAGSGQFVDECAVHLLVEIEIEAIEGAIGIAKAGLLVPTLKQPVLSAQELVGHEHRHEIDRRELLWRSVSGAGSRRSRYRRRKR